MTKKKYAILTILSLIGPVPFLQLQIANAQTDNGDNGDSSGSELNFAERHPTFCTLGPPISGALGHPLIGIMIDGICTLS